MVTAEEVQNDLIFKPNTFHINGDFNVIPQDPNQEQQWQYRPCTKLVCTEVTVPPLWDNGDTIQTGMI